MEFQNGEADARGQVACCVAQLRSRRTVVPDFRAVRDVKDYRNLDFSEHHTGSEGSSTISMESNPGFSGQGCVHSLSRVIKHPDISQVTLTTKFPIPFSQLRGGNLMVSLTVRLGTVTLTPKSQDLQVTGTNSSVGALLSATPNKDALRS